MKVRCLLISALVLFVAGILTASSYALDPKTIVGVWLFDDGSGNVAKDSSGNNNDGKLMGGPKWVDGKFGKALSFSGANDYVDAGNAESLNITGEFTIGVWTNFTDLGKYTIASKWGAIADSNYSWLLFANWFANGEVNFLVSGDGTNYTRLSSGAGAITAGNWYYIVGVYDTLTVKLYINGELINSKLDFAAVPPKLKVSSTPLRVGADSDGPGLCRYFKGAIDEVAIFKVALGKDDINNIMNNGLLNIVTAVNLSGKLATTWADIKTQ
jgi:hypothetical protein